MHTMFLLTLIKHPMTLNALSAEQSYGKEQNYPPKTVKNELLEDVGNKKFFFAIIKISRRT